MIRSVLGRFGFHLTRTQAFAQLADNLLGRRGILAYGDYGFARVETDFYNYYIANKERISLDHSQSQLGQDLWVAFLLQSFDKPRSDAGRRFFVEFGALDGKKFSNTYFLEKELGWTGILAEPIPEQYAVCVRNRSCIVDNRCVWAESGAVLQFNIVEGLNELGTIASFEGDDRHGATRTLNRQVIDVSTVSLNDLLSSYEIPKTVDYLSVDTEGSEFAILEAFDFDSYLIKTISVEHNFTPQRVRLRKLLTEKGFFRLDRSADYFDDIYLNRATFDSSSLSDS